MEYPKGRIDPVPNELILDRGSLVQVEVPPMTNIRVDGASGSLQARRGGEFAGRGFYLSREFDWHVVQDGEGYIVLVPTRKTPGSA